jgi:hypothetical protein
MVKIGYSECKRATKTTHFKSSCFHSDPVVDFVFVYMFVTVWDRWDPKFAHALTFFSDLISQKKAYRLQKVI